MRCLWAMVLSSKKLTPPIVRQAVFMARLCIDQWSLRERNHCNAWINDTLSPFSKICPISLINKIKQQLLMDMYEPSSLRFSSSVFVGCLTSTASSITRFMYSSNPCRRTRSARRHRRRLATLADPNLALYPYCQLLVKPDGDGRPLLQELEDEVDRRQQDFAPPSPMSSSTATRHGGC